MSCSKDTKIFTKQDIEKYKTTHNAIVVIIDGKLYDLTEWAPQHPGGEDILQHYNGWDASYPFRAFHAKPPPKEQYYIGTLSNDSERGETDENKNLENELKEKKESIQKFMQSYEKLHHEFITDKKKWFTLSPLWLISKLFWILMLFVMYWLCITKTIKLTQVPWIDAVIEGVILGKLWHQSAFIAHDSEHGGLLALHFDKKWDHFLGFICGNLIMGISGSWWKSSHNIHHALTNLYHGHNGKIIDEQQDQLPFWLQSKQLLKFQNFITRSILQTQKWTFVPGCLFAGRFVILAVGIGNCWHSIMEMIGILLHFSWLFYSFSFLENIYLIVFVHTVAAAVEGILHIQLELSHFVTTMMSQEESEKMPWPYFQLLVTRNIKCPKWLDWFHGGLQFQIEHHLWPRMPRHNLRSAAEKLEIVCNETGVPYQEETFLDAIVLVNKGLAAVGNHA